MTFSELLRIQLFEVSGTPITVSSLLTFVVIVLISLLASSLLQRVARRALRRTGWVEPGTISTILRLLHYAVVIVGLDEQQAHADERLVLDGGDHVAQDLGELHGVYLI